MGPVGFDSLALGVAFYPQRGRSGRFRCKMPGWTMERGVDMSDGWLTIKLRAEDGAALSVMFEPLGHTYTLESGEFMYADVLTHNDDSGDVLEIISTPGLVSLWPPGHVQTRDHEGNKLDWLN